jgi:hypothetical protein
VTNAPWEYIDFWSFKRFIKMLTPTQHTFYLKFIHDYLCLGDCHYLTANTKEQVLKICPCSKSNFEDTAHYLQCTQNPGRTEHLKNFDKNMIQSHGDTHPATFLFAYGIKCWLHKEPIHTPDLTKYPTHHCELITKAFCEQNLIGWQSGLKGFCGKTWYTLSCHQMFGPGTDTIIGEIQIRRLSRAIFNLVHELWKSRNKVLHDKALPLDLWNGRT